MRHTGRALFLSLTLLLTGCTAIGFTPAEMQPAERTYSFLDQNALTGNVTIGAVSVSPDLPTYGHVVTATGFRETLHQSFDKAGWLNKTGKPRYRLMARLDDYGVPFAIFNTKVFANVTYQLTDLKNGKTVYDQAIKIPCVKNISDVYDGGERMIAAQKCALSENVTHLLRDLNNQF